MRTFVLAIVAAVLLAAQAPVPSTAAGKGQPILAKPTEALSPLQGGAEAAPAYKRIVTAEPGMAEKASIQKDRHDRWLDGWWTLFFVGLAAVSTALMLIVSIAQAGFFWSQLRMMRRTLEDTTIAAQAAKEQSEIARREYIASNRPKLRVRLISVSIPQPGQRFVVRYEVINVGGTRATIVDNEVTVRVSQIVAHLGIAVDAIETRQFHFANELQQGEALRAESEILIFDEQNWLFGAVDEWWADRLFVIGIIRYMDDNGVLRRTAFYRVASLDLKRFRLPNFDEATSADREYED